MTLLQLTRIALAGAAAALVGGLAMVDSEPAQAAKGDQGGPGGETPPVLPISALFETDGRITITDPDDDPPVALSFPLDDAGLSLEGGHSHLAQTGNYTLQLGGGKGKKTTASERELTFDFSVVLDDAGDPPGGNPLRLNEMFMAFNRKYCREPNSDGSCPADQWFNSNADGSQPGFRDMAAGDAVPVSIALRPRSGPDYYMVCTESSNDTLGTAASDVTEFATAECIEEVESEMDGDAQPGCKKWLVYGEDRNGDGAAMTCGLWLNGAKVGVFDMDFRLQLCREDTTAVCLPLGP